MKKLLSLIVVAVMVLSMVACGTADKTADTAEPAVEAAADPAAEPAADDSAEAEAPASKEPYEIVVVPKEISAEWFQRMNVGVEWFKEAYPELNVSFKGPDTTDATLQYAVVEDLIASGVDAICIVPIDPKSLDPLLEEAQEKGIVVVTHEGSTQEHAMYNVEAFDNKAFGEFLMECLAKQMNYEGKYVTMVGSVSNASHMDWANAGIAYQQEKYPNMQLIEEDKYVEIEDDVNTCIEKTKELLKKYPDLKGILGTSGHVAPTVSELITDMNLFDQLFSVSVSQPNRSREFLENGSMKIAICWDPAAAAYAMCDLAVKILDGEEVTDGIDLGIDGFHDLRLVNGNQLYGAGWITEDMSNLGTYDF